MSKKVVTTSILRITYEPNMDDNRDIEDRIKAVIDSAVSRGELEGCEHGAHIDSWKLEVSVTRIE
jgi:hypothetical protein